MNVVIGCKYRHYKNNNYYIVIGFCKIQVNGKWKKAVLYKSGILYIKDLFCREYNEFKEKFKIIKG